jgi:hypothetical protein
MRLRVKTASGETSTVETDKGAEGSLIVAAKTLKSMGATCLQIRNVEDGVEVFDPLEPEVGIVLIEGLSLVGGDETEPVSTSNTEN